MKICILTPRFPFPENGGDVLRINNIARYLKQKGFEIILVSFYESEPCLKKDFFNLYDSIYLVKRRQFFSLIYSFIFLLFKKPIQLGYYHSNWFTRKLSHVVRTEAPDLFVAHLIRMAPYVDYNERRVKTILEMTDVLSRTYSLSSKAKGISLKKIIYARERKLVEKYEEYCCKTFSKIVLVSPNEVDYLISKYPEAKDKVYLHSNGVDCRMQIENEYNFNKICFIGNMRTLQNQDAVFNFVENIFPKIKKKLPETVFYIVGAEPPENIISLNNNNDIIVTGFVESLDDFIVDSAIAVAPVRIAAGIQNKVLVAMGCGVPVVMTSLISKAIPELHDEENCFICDDSDSFADACIKLLSDTIERNKVAQAGYTLVKEKYSWNEKLKTYEQLPAE